MASIPSTANLAPASSDALASGPIVLVGNPNSGKTTLFNALTGLRQKVGNYPGVTVEKKEGRVELADGQFARVVDLPGLYSLTPHSPDEAIAREVLLGLRPGEAPPRLVVNVVDATNLDRNLYLTSQLLEIGLPVVIALTMVDSAESHGVQVDASRLAQQVGVPVVPVTASKRGGLDELISTLQQPQDCPGTGMGWTLPSQLDPAVQQLAEQICAATLLSPQVASAESVNLLTHDVNAVTLRVTDPVLKLAHELREGLLEAEIDCAALVVQARYEWIERVTAGALTSSARKTRLPIGFNERIDRIVMHPILGYVLFFGVMAVLFQAIFTWVQWPMDQISAGMSALGAWIAGWMPTGDLRDLLIDGVIGGVGNTVVFLPQILLLFLGISLLEDTGYLVRAAFLVDRIMSRVGLHGRSFIPMLSSFACAIPGIMATRTIGDRKARLITILVAPLMSCSARLPVYALMIGAFIPSRPLFSLGTVPVLTLPGAVMLSMYVLGMVAAFCAAWVFHRTVLPGVAPSFLIEMPPYRIPSLKTALLQMAERAWLFLRRAGTIILAVSVVLWFLAAYPKRPDLPPAERMEQSYVGKAGKLIEPVIAPLGFDWKMGVGIVASFAAREVFVSAMGTIYNVEDAESDSGQTDLRQKMRQDTDPRTGKHVFTPLVAVSLMVYYVLAMQCMSTIAVVKRETNGWKWPLVQLAYMTVLAWAASFLVYQGGKALGLG